MRVLFDELIFSMQRVGGISRYYSKLIRHLNAETDWRARAVAPVSINEHLRDVPWHQIYGVKIHRAIGRKKLCSRVSRALAPILARLLKANVLHETYYRNDPLPCEGKRVTTIHDMIYELLRLDDAVSAVRAASVNRSDHVICVSENTRRDLIERFAVPEEKTSVVYLACDDFGALYRASANESPIKGGRRYLLHIGNRGGYKNFDGAIRALAAGGNTVRDLDLVSFGRVGFRQPELDLARQCGLDRARLVHVRGSDATLAKLYAEATALILPSLHEGFGLPLIEAMSAGCPVICSDASCIPEVAGDAALYFDPADVDSIRHAIETVTLDGTLRADLIRRGDLRWRHYSWKRCAEETAAVYSRISGG